MQTAPRVSVVIVNWSRREDTLECLRSLRGLDYPNYDVVVVDNASTDGSVEAVRAYYPEAVVIAHTTNLGYTGGNNAGIRYAVDHGADFVWLLNNDTVVEQSCLSELVRTADGHQRIGMVSASIMYWQDPGRVQFRGAVLDRKRFEIAKCDRPDQAGLVLWGTALLIRTAAIREVGLLREDFFAYWEDVEYSDRILQGGFENRIAERALVYHKSPLWVAGQLRRSSHYYFYMTRNGYWFWMPRTPVSRRLSFLRRYLSEVVETAQVAEAAGAADIVDACWDGVWSAATGVAGERRLDVTMPSVVRWTILAAAWLWRRATRLGTAAGLGPGRALSG
jgi:GT2 family glycosyltransferase